MSIRHFNENTRKVELVDRPVPDCACNGCTRARRGQSQPRRRPGGWQSGASVDGKPARTKGQGDRIDAIWDGSRGNRRGDGHGHLVSKDGVNADYLRDPGMDHDDYVVDNREDVVDPYDSSKGRRRRRR